ncbi:MAG: copper transporter [Solirubrobacterales bacterium]
MGYSGRYHAASLTAVLIALAVGILVGIGLADDVVSTASQELENSLRANLEEVEAEAAEAELQLDRVRDYAVATYPVLVGDRLRDREVAVVGVGGLSRDTTADITEALAPTGAEIGDVAVIGRPPDLEALEMVVPERFEGLASDSESLRGFGETVGRQLVGGGPLIDAVGDQVFSRQEGDFAEVDSVVFVAPPPPGEDEETGDAAEGAEQGQVLVESILAGAVAGPGQNVAVARSGSEAMMEPFRDEGISTVDHLDQTAGRVSMVLVLAGANGNFGTGEDSDGLVPELPVEATAETP